MYVQSTFDYSSRTGQGSEEGRGGGAERAEGINAVEHAWLIVDAKASLTHSLTHSLTLSLHSLTHSLTPLTHSLTHSLS